MTSKITRDAEHLSAAQRAFRSAKTEQQATNWLYDHYLPLAETDALYDELEAMRKELLNRVYGVGG